MEQAQSEHVGNRLASVSNAVVGVLRESYGRGPTKAKSYLNDNIVMVVLEDILTTVEKTLVNTGHEALVREVRLTYQTAEADRFKSAVEMAMGARVVTYHSQVVFDPDMAFEIFVLETAPGDEDRQAS